MIFKLSFKKMFKPIIRLTFIVILLLGVWFLYVGGFNKSLLPGFIIILCIPVIPTVYLLVEYFFVTKNQILEIANESITVTYKRSGKSHSYNIQDLKGIKLFKSAGMEKGSFPFQTAEMYYHAEIFTNDGEKLVITSIIEPSIETALSMLDSVSIEVRRTAYSTIYI